MHTLYRPYYILTFLYSTALLFDFIIILYSLNYRLSYIQTVYINEILLTS